MIGNCVIGNCVINLASDKPAVFRELARVLRAGGRVALSDIALRRALPTELASSAAAWSGCLAGAIPLDDYVAGLRAVGLTDVVAVDDHADLNAYASVEGQSLCCSPATTPGTPAIATLPCCTPTLHGDLAPLLARHDVNAFAASVKIYAVKPAW